MTDDEARALIAAARTRGACRRLGAELDLQPHTKLQVVAVARGAGVDLPDEAATWPGKRLLRRARGREAASQVRTNPIARDEAFTCVACGAEVPPHGRSARDHCPFCLAGLHVDAEVPGDRASGCGGVLQPIGVDAVNGRWRVRYRCGRCGAVRTNQVLMDGDPPDDWKRVVALSERG